jgi:hypothetical protein
MDERGRIGIPRFDLDKGLEALERDGRVTFAPDGNVAELTAGFGVSGRVPSVVIEQGIASSILRAVLAMALTSVGWKTCTTFGYTGLWRDEDGKVHVFAIDIESTLEAAEALAHKRGERVIYDFAEKNSIDV